MKQLFKKSIKLKDKDGKIYYDFSLKENKGGSWKLNLWLRGWDWPSDEKITFLNVNGVKRLYDLVNGAMMYLANERGEETK